MKITLKHMKIINTFHIVIQIILNQYINSQKLQLKQILLSYITFLTMRLHLFGLVIITANLLLIASSQRSCSLYIAKLAALLLTDVHKFEAQIAPYILFTGKGIDDLGYPGSCEKDEKHYRYSTVEIAFVQDKQRFFGYMGFCFVEYCSIEQLNKRAGFIIDYILEDYHTPIKSTFVDPELNLVFSGKALGISMLLCTLILVGMLSPFKKWIKQCRTSQDDEYIIKSVYIDLQNPNSELEQESINNSSPLLDRLSLQYKWNELLKPESSKKIYGFSLLKIITLPLIIYAMIFAESNKAAFNYISYADSIYGQFFTKVALFAYYLPDLFFIISSYLFTSKLLSINAEQQNPCAKICSAVTKKLLRLYPAYLAAIAIYWGVSGALHCGPVWYVYENQVAQCNISWWRAMLLIDNWFQNNVCYPILWFVQAEIQYMLFAAFLFILYYSSKKISYILFMVAYLTSIVLLFILSAQMLVTLDIALDSYTQIYFRSFYSHFFFYLTGMLLAFLIYSKKSKRIIQKNLIKNKMIRIVSNGICIGLVWLILYRPSIWASSEHSLSVELALIRIGMMIIFSILCLQCVFHTPNQPTSIHKYASYVYPITLLLMIVIQGAYWSVSSFMYVSTTDLINATIAMILVTVPVGVFVGLLTDFRSCIVEE